MPKVISIGNMKGGVGKTTTAVQLAQILGKRGRTLLVDADTELQSAAEWRAGEYPWTFEVIPFGELSGVNLAEYEYVVVDTKGNEQGRDLVALAQDSDLLVIPTKPDGVSAPGLAKTLQPLVAANVSNYRVLIVANVGGRGDELREALAEEGVPVLTTLVRYSTAAGDAAALHVPLEGLKGNRYAKLLALDYTSAAREVLSHV